MSKSEYKQRVSQLRLGVINAQYDLRSADFPVVIIIAGDDRVGASNLVNRLNEWMDGRYLETHVFQEITEEEAERPRFWRLWQAMPRKGRSALWVGGLMRAVREAVEGELPPEDLLDWAADLRVFQNELVADGALVLKFFLHTPADVQRERLEQAQESDSAWRYDQRDWDFLDVMEETLPVVEKVLHETTGRGTPWQIVQGDDDRQRDLTVAEAIQAGIEFRLASGPSKEPALPASYFSRARDALGSVDLSAKVEKRKYRKELTQMQGELHELAEEARRRGVSTVLAFEGWDAGGKGGAIRRVTSSLEAGDYRVIPVAAPTEDEQKYHYLWRFWRDLPRDGRVTVFDRTWYGRVLVERVEGFCDDAAWQRAYNEIVNFEQHITNHGSYLGKFWLHISPEEQLARFKARENTPYKNHKITEEDYRNRDKWDQYLVAVNEMIERTSTQSTPWTVVPANDKYSARLTVLRTVTEGLRRTLESG